MPMETLKALTTARNSRTRTESHAARSTPKKNARRCIIVMHSSCERGTNESINRMIRRQFPKGTDFEAVTDADVASVEDWINNYPREILGFQSSAQMFSAAFAATA